MLENLWKNFLWTIGSNEIEAGLSAWQLVLRTIVIYIVALMIIRVGKRRFMGGYTTFDILLGFVVGSILSRAITGTISFLDMIVVVCVLVGIHWIIAVISYKSERFGNLIKNTSRKLVVDGELQEEEMRKSKIGKNDLLQALHEKAKVESIEDVKTAYLERDGNITVIPNGCKPHLVEIKVEEGVQTVKIVIEH